MNNPGILHDLYLVSSTVLISSCFFCSFLLWIFNAGSKPKKFLSLILLLLGIVSINVTIHTGFEDTSHFEVFDFLYSMLGISIAYAAYLYFKSLMQPKDNIRKIMIQGIGAIVAYILLYWITVFIDNGSIIQIHSFQELINALPRPQVWIRIVSFLHFCIFTVWVSIQVVKMYRQHKKQIADLFSYRENISLSGLPYLLGFFCLLETGAVFDIGFAWKGGYLHIVSNFCYCGFYYVLTFLGLRQPDIYNPDEVAWQKENEKEGSGPKSLNNISISSNIRMQLIKELKILMEEQKIFLNPELRLDFVAKELKTNRTYLSLVLKEDFGENFIGFVNRYRIEEAKQLIAEMDARLSFYEIAEKVGFKSISSFNVFFKRITNQTPAEFRRRIFEENF